MSSARLRRTVRSVYGACCGYCGVCEEDVGAELTIDHYQPIAHGGTDVQENLVYCCPACNSFKADYWPDDPEVRLLHPLYDDIGEHLQLGNEGRLIALTARGEQQVQVLHLNRPPLVRYRLRVQERRWERRLQGELRDSLQLIERRLRRLEQFFE